MTVINKGGGNTRTTQDGCRLWSGGALNEFLRLVFIILVKETEVEVELNVGDQQQTFLHLCWLTLETAVFTATAV